MTSKTMITARASRLVLLGAARVPDLEAQVNAADHAELGDECRADRRLRIRHKTALGEAPEDGSLARRRRADQNHLLAARALPDVTCADLIGGLKK
jgi:hypothetical protein